MANVYILIIAFMVAIIMGRIIIPKILIISFRKRLFDVPDARKVHNRPIPRLGGVTFFPVIVFTLTLVTAFRVMMHEIQYEVFTHKMACEFLFLVAGLTLLYIVGIGDDLVGVRYSKKFVVQIISAAFFPIVGLYINNFYGVFGINEIPAWIGMPFTVILVVFITNAINLIDGIDGLASGLSMVALAIFGGIFIHYGLWNFAILAFICVGVIIPFFAYNVFGNADRGRKIFMGDTGSLTLGYIISFFVVKYCMYIPGEDMQAYGAPVVVAFAVLLVPCLDVVRVFLRRIRNGKSPFLPDKTHIHHKFLDMGFTPRTAMITIQLMSAAFCGFSLVAVKYMDNTLVFIIDIVVWVGLNIWFNKRIAKRKALITNGQQS